MPHLTLEWTANIPLATSPCDVLPDLHDALAAITGVEIANCKSRAYRVEGFHIGAGGEGAAFVHLAVRLLEGRSKEVKRALGDACLAILERRFRPAAAGLDVQVTVEICDIPHAAYFKAEIGRQEPL